MKNTARYGNGREVRTAELLQADGWLVASRRHIGGAGDLLAIKPGERPRLIEVKAGNQSPYRDFTRTDRGEMRDVAARFSAVAELAWWPKGAREPEFIAESEWPGVRIHELGK